MTHRVRRVLPFLMIGLFLSASAVASTITINPGAGLAANPAALAAFNRAAASWGSLFTDPITVTINADLAVLGPGILGQSSSVTLLGAYSTIRDQMVADAADEPGNNIVGYLPTAAQVSAYVPAGWGLSANMYATKANLKALGFAGLDAAFGLTDATIQFNSAFNFDYNNSDGVTAGYYDFETVAAHEIGHALGFVSAVDMVDYYLALGRAINIPFYPLDLFRFGPNNPSTAAEFTTFPRSLLTGAFGSFGVSYFDDLYNEWAFSTGAYTGDGRQASHWKDDNLTGFRIGMMDPTLGAGVAWSISAADLRALDVIGWDPVPEPATLLLMGTGLIAVLARTRLKKK